MRCVLCRGKPITAQSRCSSMEADQLLLARRCGANNDQQALRIVFQPGLNMNAVDPEIDVAFGREVALAPARVLFRPSLLETPYGRGRKPAGVLAKQRNERLLEVAGGDQRLIGPRLGGAL